MTNRRFIGSRLAVLLGAVMSVVSCQEHRNLMPVKVDAQLGGAVLVNGAPLVVNGEIFSSSPGQRTDVSILVSDGRNLIVKNWNFVLIVRRGKLKEAVCSKPFADWIALITETSDILRKEGDPKLADDVWQLRSHPMSTALSQRKPVMPEMIDFNSRHPRSELHVRITETAFASTPWTAILTLDSADE